jgi:hypothetical protein
MREINEIIVHTFATKKGWMRGRPFSDKVAEVKKWHLARNFNDIGYHYLISREGEIHTGRKLGVAGAHTKGHNRNSVGISLEGGHGHSRKEPFLDVYTVKQGKSLLQLMDKLQGEYGPLMISPHNKYANKECPAFDLDAFLKQSPVESASQPKTPVGAIGIGIVATIGTALVLFLDKIQTFIGGLF